MARIPIIEDEMRLCQIYCAALGYTNPSHELVLTSTGEGVSNRLCMHDWP